MTIAIVESTGNVLTTEESTEFVVQFGSDILTTNVDNTLVITHSDSSTVLVERESGSVVLAGFQGPQGVPGVNEDDIVYSKRIDFINEDTLYKAEAPVGSSETTSVWRIRKVVISADGDVSETWASGTASFDKQWSLRTTYTYS